MRALAPFLLTALLLTFSAEMGANAATDSAGSVVLARWTLEAFTASESGRCLWAQDAAGNLRVEIAAPGQSPSAADLLGWRGDGWTLILAAGAEATWNRWHERWELPPERLHEWVLPALVCPVAADTGSGELRTRPQPRFAMDTAPSGHSWCLDSPATTDGRSRFRANLVERGRGRGAATETVTARWSRADCHTSGARLTLTSTRRPGRLTLEILAAADSGPVAAEAFLPLWPLENSLDMSRILRELAVDHGVSSSLRDPK